MVCKLMYYPGANADDRLVKYLKFVDATIPVARINLKMIAINGSITFQQAILAAVSF